MMTARWPAGQGAGRVSTRRRVRPDRVAIQLLAESVQPAAKGYGVIAQEAAEFQGGWAFAPVAPAIQRPNRYGEKLGHFFEREQALSRSRSSQRALPPFLPHRGGRCPRGVAPNSRRPGAHSSIPRPKPGLAPCWPRSSSNASET